MGRTYNSPHYQDFMPDKVFGKDFYRANENKCNAMGSKTCYYVLEKRE